jgi:DNA-binding HxlR family transcriptional regulator
MDTSTVFPNVFNAACGTRAVLNLLANKWTILVVSALAESPRRYGQLRLKIDAITPKMLAQTLHQLERDGLITRVVYPTNPPTVEYSLSPLGTTLLEPFSALCKWSEKYFTDVESARSRYDQQVKE